MKRIHIVISVISLVALIHSTTSYAMPEYAAKEGKPCAFCHLDPAGGGPRNPIGQVYEKNNHKFPPNFEAKKILEETKKSEISFNPFLEVRAVYIKSFDIHAEKAETAATPRCDSCHSSKDTFLLMQGEVGISAKIADKLNLRLSNNMGTPQDMFVIINAIPEKFYIKVGQFEIPFGLKQRDHNILVRQGFGIGSNRRDAGMAVGGTYSNLSYSAAVFNGDLDLGAIAGQTTDRNQSKAVVINADLRYKFLRVGGSLLTDRVSQIIKTKAEAEAVDVTQTRIAAFANATYKNLSAEAEFDAGKDAKPKELNSFGYFASLIFKPHPKFKTIARYEAFDPKQRVSLIAEYNFIQNGSIQLNYWANIAANKDAPLGGLDTNTKRELEGKDQLILVSHFWF